MILGRDRMETLRYHTVRYGLRGAVDISCYMGYGWRAANGEYAIGSLLHEIQPLRIKCKGAVDKHRGAFPAFCHGKSRCPGNAAHPFGAGYVPYADRIVPDQADGKIGWRHELLIVMVGTSLAEPACNA